ncbi:MAG: hypothetical protein AAB389_01025 [Patescibacteria group bacterium]
MIEALVIIVPIAFLGGLFALSSYLGKQNKREEDKEYGVGKFKKGTICAECSAPQRPEKGLVISVNFLPKMYLCEAHEKLVHDEKYMAALFQRYSRQNK